ncbi:hypothetical protein ACFQS1_34760 [Paractinoplanes rhizophilus]|uniref:Uncharacterized protein n=1 Tax=Paractinoplanes rhizophilus TaxID=1416877 RepID=A0ABW2I2M5_9ACTN
MLTPGGGHQYERHPDRDGENERRHHHLEDRVQRHECPAEVAEQTQSHDQADGGDQQIDDRRAIRTASRRSLPAESVEREDSMVNLRFRPHSTVGA